MSCNTCHGSGMYVRIHQIAPGMVQQIQTQCRDCSGQGERIPGIDSIKRYLFIKIILTITLYLKIGRNII